MIDFSLPAVCPCVVGPYTCKLLSNLTEDGWCVQCQATTVLPPGGTYIVLIDKCGILHTGSSLKFLPISSLTF